MSYWACARLELRREALGLDSLRRGGFEPYYPRIREHRVRNDRRIAVMPPLFLGYVFLRIVAQWYAARWAPGVLGILMDGDHPARVPDCVIDDIRSREVRGYVLLPPEQPRLQPGDAVRIVRGALAGLPGLVDGLRPNERVALLLAALGRVTLSAADVEAAG
jgi:transcriptional antiterminator RfaH